MPCGAVGLVASLLCPPSRSDRRHARRLRRIDEARLAELIRHVGEAVDRFRAGELDAFETDQIIFQYSRAARSLEVLQPHRHRVHRGSDRRACTGRLVGTRRAEAAMKLAAGISRRPDTRRLHSVEIDQGDLESTRPRSYSSANEVGKRSKHDQNRRRTGGSPGRRIVAALIWTSRGLHAIVMDNGPSIKALFACTALVLAGFALGSATWILTGTKTREALSRRRGNARGDSALRAVRAS